MATNTAQRQRSNMPYTPNTAPHLGGIEQSAMPEERLSAIDTRLRYLYANGMQDSPEYEQLRSDGVRLRNQLGRDRYSTAWRGTMHERSPAWRDSMHQVQRDTQAPWLGWQHTEAIEKPGLPVGAATVGMMPPKDPRDAWQDWQHNNAQNTMPMPPKDPRDYTEYMRQQTAAAFDRPMPPKDPRDPEQLEPAVQRDYSWLRSAGAIGGAILNRALGGPQIQTQFGVHSNRVAQLNEEQAARQEAEAQQQMQIANRDYRVEGDRDAATQAAAQFNQQMSQQNAASGAGAAVLASQQTVDPSRFNQLYMQRGDEMRERGIRSYDEAAANRRYAEARRSDADEMDRYVNDVNQQNRQSAALSRGDDPNRFNAVTRAQTSAVPTETTSRAQSEADYMRQQTAIAREGRANQPLDVQKQSYTAEQETAADNRTRALDMRPEDKAAFRRAFLLGYTDGGALWEQLRADWNNKHRDATPVGPRIK